jgi:hypothetical protein
MHSCKSTLVFIDHAPSNAEKDHSSKHTAWGSIINLTGSNSEEEQAPKQEEHIPEEEELDRIHEDDLEEHMVMEDSIGSTWHEEEAEHPVVEDTFETLCGDRLCAWLCAKKKERRRGAQ